MRKVIFAAFFILMFLLAPLQTKVLGDVVEESKTLYIQADPDANVTYSSIMNIVNNTTNQRFTNFNLLVEPFITATGIDGGYAGSMLPPARFQLNATELSTPTPTQHNDLVLATTVEFKKKNLLSGSSESWWRCPLWYNYSTNSNFVMEFKIFHVDLPRKVNLTFLTSDNTEPVPSAESHPSLVFERVYTSCGGIRNNEQYYTEDYIPIPINDTWNSSKPNLLTASEIAWIEETDGYNATGDFEYYQTYNYSFVWVNVTAPIYPNESYMVIWNFFDVSIPTGDEGACWVTATDIGRSDYGRSLLSWNSQDVYEIPIDLDCSVIFRTGLGDGVTGTNLTYNDPDYIDHTSTFDNTNFESNLWGFQSNFSNSFVTDGWQTSVSSASYFWIYRDAATEQAFFEANRTGNLVNLTGHYGRLFYDLTSLPFPSEGETTKIALQLRGASYENSNHGIVSHNAGIGLYFEKDSGEGNHLWLTITRRTSVEIDGTVIIDNYISWTDSSTNTQYASLPDTMPADIYVSIQNDENQDETYLYIYDQLLPTRRIFGMAITDKDSSVGSADSISIYSAVNYDAAFSGSTSYWTSYMLSDIDAGVVMKVDKITMIDRTSILSWSQINPSSDISISKHDFKDGFETIVPEYNPVVGVGWNIKCLGFTSSDTTGNSYNGIYQTQSLVVTAARRLFASCYYQMRFNDSAEPYGGATYIQLGIHGWTGSAWTSKYSYGYNLDSAWHQISTGHLYGSFSQINVTIYVFYPTTVSGDIDIKLTFVDNVKVFSIQSGPWNTAEFYQRIDQSELNSTNYLTFMMPFRHVYEPEFSPIVSLQFWDATGSVTGTVQRSMPTDFHNDFLIFSMNRTNVPADAVYVRISLVSFGNSTYIFLHDRNSDFYLNNETLARYNHFEKFDSSSTTTAETFFSPYYSLKATAGQWTNADSYFTTTPFYFVRVHFVRFVGNDPEVISVQMYNVDLENFEIFRFNMGQFGQVYNNEEWLLYLEIRNRPSFLDRIVDLFADFFKWLANTPIGKLLGAIGKFIIDTIKFMVQLIQTLAKIILEVIVFIISVVIYFIGSWIMWKFVKFWTLIGEGKPEEAVSEVTEVTEKVTSTAKGMI